MKKTLFLILVIPMALLACHIQSVEPPSAEPITVVNPASGSTLFDPTVISAVSGGGYSFTHVNFYIDTVLVATDSVAPYLFYWDIFNYNSNTSHLIIAVGFTADSSYQSAPVNVTISYSLGFSLAANYHPNSQHAVGIKNYQNALFVSEEDQGIEIIDITDIVSPQFVSRFNPQGFSSHTIAAFPNVFIANGSQGVVRANFSNPDSLVETARFMDQGLINDVKLIGNNLLVAENGNIVILNRNADSLQELSRLVISAIFYYAATSGNYAYVAGDNALFIVNCTNPNAISLAGSYNNLGLSLGVAIADTIAFVANGDQGVTAISIANPANPRFLSRFDPQPYITTVAAGDNVLFAAAREGDIFAIDYNTPDTLMQLAHYTTGNLIGEIDYQSHYLFVAASAAVNIFRFIR